MGYLRLRDEALLHIVNNSQSNHAVAVDGVAAISKMVAFGRSCSKGGQPALSFIGSNEADRSDKSDWSPTTPIPRGLDKGWGWLPLAAVGLA